MKCPKCQFDNREKAKFCKDCGCKLELACPECGAKFISPSKFCDECGYDLSKITKAPKIDYSTPESYTPKHLANKILTTRSSIEGERKNVTVLFADIANYTSISERLDPEEVHQIMDGCFQILMDQIHNYDGTINQFTGDGVMALFGAPVAHEDHAHRSCHAALSIQDAMKDYTAKIDKETGVEFMMRIGINSGPVIVGAIGDDLRMDYTAVGDTTNLGSRMESIAQPGSVVTSENSYNLVKDYFEFESLGKLEVKGKETPQGAFKLIKAGDVKTRIGASVAKGLTKFVGRKNSMAALLDVFNKAKSGSGQVVGLVGEAGVGKSRILLELRNLLNRDDFIYLEGRCIHYGGSMPYLPILDIIKSYFGIKEDDREFIIKKKVQEEILSLDQKLTDTIPPIHDLLAVKIDDDRYAKLDPAVRKEKIFEALRNFMIRLSQEKPIIIAIEDLHWIDKTSENYLDYLIDWLANTPMHLILLYRPEYVHQWGSKSYYTKIGLDQLGLSSSGELVRAILEEGDVAPELRQLILNRSAGNPLFMEEFTHALLENGSIGRDNDKFILEGKANDIQVPDTIQGIIAARLDQLEDNLKRTMQVASVIGRDFAYRILQTITGMKKELKSHLLNLQGLEFVYEKNLFPELEYIFKHALTQEVAYNSLLLKRRKEIHEKIGVAIEDLYSDRLEEFYEMLAYHYARSNNTDKAIKYLINANEKAYNQNALEEAFAFYEEAYKILKRQPNTKDNQLRLIKLIVDQTWLFQLLFKYPEYFELLKNHEYIAKVLEDNNAVGQFYQVLAQCQWWFGSLDEATKSHLHSKQSIKKTGNKILLIYAGVIIIWINVWKGNLDQAINSERDFDSLSVNDIDDDLYVRFFCGISWAHTFAGNWNRAIKYGKKALKYAQETSNQSRISFAAFILSIAYNHKRDLDRAFKYAQLSVDKAPTVADKVWGQSCLVWAQIRTDEPIKLAEIGLSLIPMYQAVGFIGGEVSAKMAVAEGYLSARKYNDAKQYALDSLNITLKIGMKYHTGLAHRILGVVEMQSNETKAREHFETSIEIFSDIGAENELAMAYAGYANHKKKIGMKEGAREYYEKALAIFERLGTLQEPERIKAQLDKLLSG